MKSQHGFTLIELMIVVTVIAILTAIAMPAYSDHVIRGKLLEATSSLSDGRIKMEQYFQDNRTYAGADVAAGVCPTATANFDYTCTGLSATAYLITATGKASQNLNSFSYTIDQANAHVTTGLKAGWGNYPVSCWITKKGGSC